VVLIYYQDQPTVFARIESIEPDVKKDWYHISMLLLTIPTQEVTWILREAYINGETFTMGGRDIRLEEVKGTSSGRENLAAGQGKDSEGPPKSGNIVPFKKPGS
jgi:hypothetical protein